jgi:hypothetical protein
MRYAIMFLTTTLFLTSCAGADLGNSKTKALILPDVKEYSAAQQTALADEIEFIRETKKTRPVCLTFSKDYHVMQQETRAAQQAFGVR